MDRSRAQKQSPVQTGRKLRARVGKREAQKQAPRVPPTSENREIEYGIRAFPLPSYWSLPLSCPKCVSDVKKIPRSLCKVRDEELRASAVAKDGSPAPSGRRTGVCRPWAGWGFDSEAL